MFQTQVVVKCDIHILYAMHFLHEYYTFRDY
jgi:hypothetical protein